MTSTDPTPKPCPRCDGTGGLTPNTPSVPEMLNAPECPDCDGTGEVWPPEETHVVTDNPYSVSVHISDTEAIYLDTFTQESHGDDYQRHAEVFAMEQSRGGKVVTVDEDDGPHSATERARFEDGEQVS